MNSVADLLKLKWSPGGRGPAGVDCVGMVLLYARMVGHDVPDIETTDARKGDSATLLSLCNPFSGDLKSFKHNAIFFGKGGAPSHVGVVLPSGKLLHTCYGGPRIDNDLRLLERVGMLPLGAIPLSDSRRLIDGLKTAGLGTAITFVIVALVISVLASVASYALAPKAPKFGTQNGRYGYDALITQVRSDIAIPDLFGTVTMAGNSPFTEGVDKHSAVTNVALQKACKVVVFGLGALLDFGTASYQFRINGLSYDDSYWFNAGATGFEPDPVQVKAEAIDGIIGAAFFRPSMTLYMGSPALSVPVDVRAHYVRDFPIYGFNGCAYVVFRMVDSSKYSNFNMLARCKGRAMRTIVATGLGRAFTALITLTCTGVKKYVILSVGVPQTDISSVTNITHSLGGTYVEYGPGGYSGNVFKINKTKGQIEFPANVPAAGGTLTFNAIRYSSAYSANPATHLANLLTDTNRGRGLPESKLDWGSFLAARDYCDEVITTQTEAGPVTSPRYTCNYVMDQRRPLQDHMREILSACRGMLLLANGKLKMKIIKSDELSLYSFNPTNILADSFASELADQVGRSNEISVQFHSKDAFNGEATIRVSDVGDQEGRAALGNEGVSTESLKYSAVDTSAQARRLANEVIGTELDVRWVVAFTTSIRGLALEPGDAIDITHPSQPRWMEKLFRIDEISLTESDQIQIRASELLSI